MCYKSGSVIIVLVMLVMSLNACGDTTPIPTTQAIVPKVPATEQATVTPSETSPVVQPASPNSLTASPLIPKTQAGSPVTTVQVSPSSLPPGMATSTNTVVATVAPTFTPRPTYTPEPTDTPRPTNTSMPTSTSISAKKGKIVFSSQGQIYLINPDGSSKTKVANGVSPIFSPENSKIAFIDPQGQDIFTGDAVATINSINLDGSGRQQICKVEAHIFLSLLRWSPRGKYIAYNYYPTNTGGGLPLLGLCDTGSHQASDYHLGKYDTRAIYDWTPDGNNSIWEIAVSAGDYNLYYGDPDKGGGDLRPLTTGQNRLQFQESQPLVSYYDRAFISPDGKTAAVAGSKLFFVSLPGQKSPFQGQVLANPGGNVLGMAWAGDGKALALIIGQYQDQGGPIKTVDLSSGGVNGKLNTLVDNATSVDWMR